MIFYVLTIINLTLIAVAMFMTIRTPIKYHTTKRWNVYIIYSLTTLVSLAYFNIQTISTDGRWQYRLISTIIAISKIYFADTLKYSSIRKK